MRLKFAVVILLQVLLLIGIVGYREYRVATGERILLQSAPVDPRDLFRGDYVTLAYDLSTIDLDRAGIRENLRRNDRIFAALEKAEDGTYRMASASGTVPPGGKFLKGRVTRVNEKAVRYQVTLRTDGAGDRTFEPRWFSFHEGERVILCLDRGGQVQASLREKEDARCRAGEAVAGTVTAVKKISFRQASVEYGIEHFFLEEGKGKAVERARNARDLRVEVALREDGRGLITGLYLDGRRIP
ncbi:MAG: GDYXXLXY domain-containing protein [Syntrophaceae bacterium]|nr:GDYXXLXY domain-containing protein [Syntrophaceae bacterium]